MTPQAEPSAEASEVDRELRALLQHEAAERRRLRQAVLAAALLHAVLLVVTFPRLLATPDAPRAPAKQVYVVQQVRFKPPAQPRAEVPERKTKKIPIPDPTPDDPEPIEIELELPEVELPPTDALVFGVPDAPSEAAASGRGDVLQVGGGVTAPEKIFAPQPRYSEEARQGRVQGTVILQAVIEATGDVSDVEVLKGLPLGLSESAIETVRQWRFKPATSNGRPVAVYLNLLVNFSLQ